MACRSRCDNSFVSASTAGSQASPKHGAADPQARYCPWRVRCRKRSIARVVARRTRRPGIWRTGWCRENSSAARNVSWKQSAASARLPNSRYAVCHTAGPCSVTIACQSYTCKDVPRSACDRLQRADLHVRQVTTCNCLRVLLYVVAARAFITARTRRDGQAQTFMSRGPKKSYFLRRVCAFFLAFRRSRGENAFVDFAT